MSLLTMPRKPMNSAVVAPITSTKLSAASESWKSGDMRATMKMPAVTMVAAWISAEIGVGPSIESGSHTCSGNCAHNARGHHGRRVDQRRDRRRAFHRVGQPYVQRELRALAHRPDEEADA